MKIIRELQKNLERHIAPNKVIVIVGARRVGKTYLLNQLIKKLKEPYLFLMGKILKHTDYLNLRLQSIIARFLVIINY